METLTQVAIGIGVCGAVFALMTSVFFVSHRLRRRTRIARLTHLKQERPSATRQQFVDWFVARGVRQSVAGTVYEFLQSRCDISDFPFDPLDPLESVCDIVVHEEIDDILQEMGYRTLSDSEWDALDWDALGLPPPSEPDAPVASLVYLVEALDGRV